MAEAYRSAYKYLKTHTHTHIVKFQPFISFQGSMVKLLLQQKRKPVVVRVRVSCKHIEQTDAVVKFTLYLPYKQGSADPL